MKKEKYVLVKLLDATVDPMYDIEKPSVLDEQGIRYEIVEELSVRYRTSIGIAISDYGYPTKKILRLSKISADHC